jgi:hypothetical protein
MLIAFTYGIERLFKGSSLQLADIYFIIRPWWVIYSKFTVFYLLKLLPNHQHRQTGKEGHHALHKSPPLLVLPCILDQFLFGRNKTLFDYLLSFLGPLGPLFVDQVFFIVVLRKEPRVRYRQHLDLADCLKRLMLPRVSRELFQNTVKLIGLAFYAKLTSLSSSSSF